MQLTSASRISPKNDVGGADNINDKSVEQVMNAAAETTLMELDNGDIQEDSIAKGGSMMKSLEQVVAGDGKPAPMDVDNDTLKQNRICEATDEAPNPSIKEHLQLNGTGEINSGELSDCERMITSKSPSVEQCSTRINAPTTTGAIGNNASGSSSDEHLPMANGTMEVSAPNNHDVNMTATNTEPTLKSANVEANLTSGKPDSRLELDKECTETAEQRNSEDLSKSNTPTKSDLSLEESSSRDDNRDKHSFEDVPTPTNSRAHETVEDPNSNQSCSRPDKTSFELTRAGESELSEGTSSEATEAIAEVLPTDRSGVNSALSENPITNDKMDRCDSVDQQTVETLTSSQSGNKQGAEIQIDVPAGVKDKTDQSADRVSTSAQSATDSNDTGFASNANASQEAAAGDVSIKTSTVGGAELGGTHPPSIAVPTNKLQTQKGVSIATMATKTYHTEASPLSFKKVVVQPDKPKDAKSLFNIQPPTGDSAMSTKADTPSAQDIKDGHAYLRPMPKFLYQLGLSLLREVVYEGLAEHVGSLREKGDKKYSEEQFQSLQKSLANLRKDNQHLTLKSDKVCDAVIDGHRCKFRTESQLALETHWSTSHLNRSNRYVCARCGTSTPHVTIFRNHMMDKHGLDGIINKPLPFFPCKLCFFDSSSSNRLQTHLNSCSKNFQVANNLKPNGLASTPLDETIFKPAPPKKVVTTVTLKNSLPGMAPRPTNAMPIMQPAAKGVPRHLASIRPAVATPSRLPGSGTLQQIKINSQIVHSANTQTATHRSPAPVTQVATTPPSVNTDVVSCEICGGFIQGLHAMRVHMQWCHHINISHLKKPEFQCTTCLKRFWTVQGMAKHSTTCSEKLPAVNVADSKSSCFICCKPYFTSQVEHLLAKHLNDLKLMVEIKKCLAPKCSPFLFGSVENLQFHLAKEHRLKMTGLAGLASANVSNIKFQPFCSICKLKFSTSNDFAKHCAEKHVHKCDLCGAQCSTLQGLKEHETMVHPFRFCLACDKQIKRTHYKIHLFSMHNADKCRPSLKRISDEEYAEYSKKPKLPNWS